MKTYTLTPAQSKEMFNYLENHVEFSSTDAVFEIELGEDTFLSLDLYLNIDSEYESEIGYYAEVSRNYGIRKAIVVEYDEDNNESEYVLSEQDMNNINEYLACA